MIHKTSLKGTNKHYGRILGLKTPWEVEEIEVKMEEVRIVIKITTKKGSKLPCPLCNKLCSKEDHLKERTWRHLNIMEFETTIKARIPRVNCKEHGIKIVEVPWATAYSRYTSQFESHAIDILEGTKNITAAKKILKISWDSIHAIQKRAVERGLNRRNKDEKIKYIGVDEKSFLKGHSYTSVLNDLERGRVLDVVEGRTYESTKELFESTFTIEQQSQVLAVAMDMWKAFMKATDHVFPQADKVHDKFHISGYLNKSVDTVRKAEHKKQMKEGNDILKGSKYFWLTSPENMSKTTKKSFQEICNLELKVSKAWNLKELFKHFWDYKCETSARKFFKKWYFKATHSRLKPIIQVAKMLKRHFNGLIAYLKHHITNAVSEGLNSKIQFIKASARGFRNFQNYRISILFNCGKLNLYP